MKCEFCDSDHDGTFASGRFCTKKCAKRWSTSQNRKQINERVQNTLKEKFRDSIRPIIDQLEKNVLEVKSIVAQSTSLWNVRENLKNSVLSKFESSPTAISEFIKSQNFDISHFRKQSKPKTFEEVFCKRPNEPKGKLKHHLLKIGIEHKCQICGLGPEWNKKSLTLQVDHINGDNSDHRLENLRFLCPNCHTQTDTFCWKNVKRLVSVK